MHQKLDYFWVQLIENGSKYINFRTSSHLGETNFIHAQR